jgi:hypothetical protein
VDVAPGAAGLLAQGGKVDVVLEADPASQLGADGVDQPAAGARQVGAEREPRAQRVEHAGQPDRGVVDARPVQPVLGGKAVGQLADLAGGGLGAAAGALVAAGPHPARDVGQGGPHPVAADVDADHPAGLGVQAVDDRAGALGAARPAGLVHEAGPLQHRQRQRDRGLGEAASAGRLGPRHGPLAADQVEQVALVDGPQQTGGAGRVLGLGPGVRLRPFPGVRKLS